MAKASLAKMVNEPVEFVNADFVAGADEAVLRVNAFVEKIADSSEIEGDVTLELAQLGRGTSTPIQTWTFSPGDDVEEMTSMIVDRAIEDGTEVGSGKMRYMVTVVNHKGRCSFSIDFPESDDNDPEEPPTEKGLVSQQMKHNEKLVRMITGMVETTTRAIQTQLTEQTQRVRGFEAQQIEQIKVFAELYDQRAKQQVEEKKLLASESRKDEVTGMLMQGIPGILNKLLGPKMGAPIVSEPNPVENMMQGFLSTVTPDQLQGLMSSGLFRQDQILGFLEIFKAVHERSEARVGPGVQAIQQVRQGHAESQGQVSNPGPQPDPMEPK